MYITHKINHNVNGSADKQKIKKSMSNFKCARHKTRYIQKKNYSKIKY